ncbi:MULTISPECIES: DsrE/DsrF/DrsH-like family protein [Ignavibacterium]|uniref:DsrE/DsrF/DrsH-like family protein n=1 Tax=Ignavibacterium TaxID=795750 RepID=UPI0025C38A7C|nr:MULTISPECIES: DsrE/DsrF/DrsH-like family protein [Ignavibacterium]MBI5661458.1 DsrE/DsrF/DrsH-like family protein [Ignavibacterium album]
MADQQEEIKKVSIIVSRGSLDGVYPGLILANGARMEGIEANLFFTFFGLDAIVDKRMDKLSIVTVGNAAMRLPWGQKMPTWLGTIPGMAAFATWMMKKEMEKLDVPPVREFLQMIKDSGGEIYACKLAMDMFHLKKEDLWEGVSEVLTVGEFYQKAAGGTVLFT